MAAAGGGAEAARLDDVDGQAQPQRAGRGGAVRGQVGGLTCLLLSVCFSLFTFICLLSFQGEGGERRGVEQPQPPIPVRHLRGRYGTFPIKESTVIYPLGVYIQKGPT